MSITTDDLTWMFKDPEWKNKFLIGSLLGLAPSFIPLFGLLAYLVIYGYALILMRAEMQGEPRKLAAWDDIGKMLVDGLQAVGASIGYMAPGLIVLFAGFITFFVTTFGAGFWGASGTDAAQNLGLFILSFIVGEFALFLSIGIGVGLFYLGFIFVPVAIGQYIRTGKIASGYHLGEVWRILRAFPSGFILAWLVYFGFSTLTSVVMYLAYMTIVLCLLIPFLAGPIGFYLALLFAQFFGRAYREAVGRAGLVTTGMVTPPSGAVAASRSL